MPASMNQKFPDHFSGVASRYADFRPLYPEALFAYLAGLVPAGSVWDCAAGNGQATVGLARHFSSVVATDASAEQIASATPRPGVEFRVATAEESGLPDGFAGLITVAQALHWFDLERFYAEADRVLRPGGVLAVWAYGIIEVEGEEVNRLALDFYGGTVGPYWPPQTKLVESGYRTLPFPFQEITPPAFRMETRWTLEQLLGYFGTWSATGRCLKETGRDPLPPLAEAMRQVWGDEETPRLVGWPLSLRLSRK
jgi:ubiquinone/menaquinone biosynthesis C-methylase UbiE